MITGIFFAEKETWYNVQINGLRDLQEENFHVGLYFYDNLFPKYNHYIGKYFKPYTSCSIKGNGTDIYLNAGGEKPWKHSNVDGEFNITITSSSSDIGNTCLAKK